MDFHPIRQFRSLKLARAFYYETLESIPEREKTVAQAARPFLLEPPITDYLASVLYRIFDGENPIIPRLMSVLFWLAAAAMLYFLAKDLISSDAGIAAVTFFLFLPFGVRASRSFQPDPLMIMMFLAAIFAVFKYYMQSSTRNLILTCILSSLAIFIKPFCLFPIFGAFFAMGIAKTGFRKVMLGPAPLVFIAASILPTLLYYGYGIYAAGFLKSQADSSFMPHLLLEPFYWKDWLRQASNVIGKWPLLVSIVGVLLIRSEIKRSFLLGLWIGYVVFGLVFTYHIHTHDYYQLMLIPIVALSLGKTASLLLGQLTSSTIIWRFAVWCLFVFTILISIRSSIPHLGNAGFVEQVKIHEEIGDLVNHSTNTLFLDTDYGDVLMYYGRIAGNFWPTKVEFEYFNIKGEPYLRGKEHLDRMISEKSPDYFIVSSTEELQGQEDLKQVLDNEYAIVAETPDYIIYDLRNTKIK